ncbi:MAG: hypothetical protein JXA30_04025 [Deltaproteobacteria bacterium]|nr:hypothetical protein [Deltaproteobacteria bacterium]
MGTNRNKLPKPIRRWIGVILALLIGPAFPLGCGLDGFDLDFEQCKSDSDCPGAERCSRAFLGTLCVLTCENDRDCPSHQYCDDGLNFLEFNACEDGCRSDEQCPIGQFCSNGDCMVGCRKHTECDAEERCQAGACVPGCRTDAECNEGEICAPEPTVCLIGCPSRTFACRPGCRADADCSEGFCVSTTTDEWGTCSVSIACGDTTCAARINAITCCFSEEGSECGVELPWLVLLKVGECARASDPSGPSDCTRVGIAQGCQTTTGECGALIPDDPPICAVPAGGFGDDEP